MADLIVPEQRSRQHLPAPMSRQADFGRLYKQGKRFRAPALTLVVLKHEASCRAAFVVSRKVARQATRRNRVRRWLREALRRLILVSECHADLALIAHPGAVDAGYWRLHSELAGLVRRASLPLQPTAPCCTEGGQ